MSLRIRIACGQARRLFGEHAAPVLAGLVPAIRSGTVPRPMAGTSPTMTMKVTPEANRVLVSDRFVLHAMTLVLGG